MDNLKTNFGKLKVNKNQKRPLLAKNDNLLKKVSLGKDFYSTSSVRDLIFKIL